MAPHPGHASLASTSTSTLDSFPPLTDTQRRRVERTLAALPPGARTWADLTSANLAAAGSDRDPDDLYEVWLKLVWQDGVTWHDKWHNAKRQLDALVSAPETRHQPRRDDQPAKRHRRRPSDNLDLLREKLDRVTLAATRAADHEYEHRARHQRQSTQVSPPRLRPHSTPPRPLLVHPPPAASVPVLPDQHAGHSSSEEHFVGVPRPRPADPSRRRRLVLPPRASRRVLPTTTPTATDNDAATDGEFLRPAPTRRRRSSFPALPTEAANVDHLPSVPVTSTPARPVPVTAAEPDPTPLLSARLSSLPPPPIPLQYDHGPQSPASSSSSLLISSSLSPPEAVARAIQFSRLRLLLPLFSHWHLRTATIRQRELDLDEKRRDWLRRCAVEQWQARWRAARASEGEDRTRADQFNANRLVLRGIRQWRSALRERARRQKISSLTTARDRLVLRVDRRLVLTSLHAWRHRAAARVVARKRATNLARAAWSAWRRRRVALRDREVWMVHRAQELVDRSDVRRATHAATWWIRRTALRVKENAEREAKDRRVTTKVWEVWRTKAYEIDRIRRLEALAAYSDSRRLATESLTRWVSQLVHRRQQESIACSFHDGTVIPKRAASHLRRWRLRLRDRLSIRVRADDLAARTIDRWLERVDHVRVGLNSRAEARRAERDVTLVRVSFSSWRASTARVARLAHAAEGVHRTRLLVQLVGKWRAGVERERVQTKRADVVRDFMVLRAAWRRWTEREWERRREAWEANKRRERVREAWQFWVDQTQRKRLERELVVRFRRKQDRRLAAVTLHVWMENVISRKEREREAAKWSDARVARFGFAGWAAATVRAEQRLVLADAQRAVKLEELRDRVFRQWYEAARRSRVLRARCTAVLARRRCARLQVAFDAWRERSLRRSEDEVARRREVRELEEAWEWWKARTRTLAAIEFRKVRLGSRALACWRAWTPSRELSLQAVQTDHRAIATGALQVWRIKATAKFALRSIRDSGRLRVGNSPSSASPPLRVSTSQVSPAGPSSPSPSHVSLSTTSRSALASTIATSFSRRSPSRELSSAADDRLQAAAAAVATRRSSAMERRPSSSSSSSAPSRPRLSAEYASAQPSQARHRRRRKSIISLMGARSESGAGQRRSYDSSEDEYGRQDWRETRSEGGGPPIGRERDVRSQHEALRRRLREAAANATYQ